MMKHNDLNNFKDSEISYEITWLQNQYYTIISVAVAAQ